ncbi:MAG: hypothetical protein WBD22_02990 [Pyrinomonadaceae bacterium]
MKTFTCTQCGALIEQISLKDRWARCDYCGARILLPEDVKSTKVLAEPAFTEPGEMSSQNQLSIRFFGILGLVGILFVFLIGGGLAVGSYRNKQREAKYRAERQRAATTYSPAPTPTLIPVYIPTPPTSTPMPEILYRVNVKWDGPDDMEHYEEPAIDYPDLPTYDIAELKRTVFKNRSVGVRIKIDTSGEVTEAEAVSGHPALRRASVEAAKRSLFSNRRKPTTRIITYFFRLTDE